MHKTYISTYDNLTKEELMEILRSRQDVFIVEQNCPYPDIDDHDYKSIFVFIKNDGKLCASMRMFEKDEKTIQLGRILTLERGKGWGRIMMEDALACIRSLDRYEQVYIEAQTYATGFYEKFGFRTASDEFLEDGIPHVVMLADLKA